MHNFAVYGLSLQRKQKRNTVMKKKKDLQDNYVKAARRGSREAEIEIYGRPLGRTKVHKSKKIYSRKGGKAALRKLPSDFYGRCGKKREV